MGAEAPYTTHEVQVLLVSRGFAAQENSQVTWHRDRDRILVSLDPNRRSCVWFDRTANQKATLSFNALANKLTSEQ